MSRRLQNEQCYRIRVALRPSVAGPATGYNENPPVFHDFSTGESMTEAEATLGLDPARGRSSPPRPIEVLQNVL